MERQPQRSLPYPGNERSNGNRPSNTDLIYPPQPSSCWPASITRMTMQLPSTCPCQPTQPPVPGCRTVKSQQPQSLQLQGAERLNGNRPNNRKHISPAHLAWSLPESVTKMTPTERSHAHDAYANTRVSSFRIGSQCGGRATITSFQHRKTVNTHRRER